MFFFFFARTEQHFDAKIYAIIQHACYMFRNFSAIFRELSDKEKKHKIG